MPRPWRLRSTAAGDDERRLERLRWTVVGLLGLLGLGALLELAGVRSMVLDLLMVAAVGLLAAGLALQDRLGGGAAARRLTRDASLTRILQGLSRSVSPESVVEAIVQELRSTSGADHVVVARVRRPDQVVEVTLVAASTTVPLSRTELRPDIVRQLSTTAPDVGEHGAKESDRPTPETALQEAADEIALRVRSAYGLSNLLVLPLAHERHFVGALILSKRTREPWTEADRTLLGWAATEVSAAFGRAYAHEEAERGANIDALTGLPNRRYFEELLTILRPGRRSGDRTGVLMVDVDHFKRLNDRYGHSTGDQVLTAIAGAITASVRAEDTPARYGGEEFVVVLRRASAGQAADVGERIRMAVASLPIAQLGLDEPVTVSVGVAVAGEDESEIRPLVERADQALYLAKRRGRDRVEAA
jgi:diguanylate cyclase (GGDEF)-like protein